MNTDLYQQCTDYDIVTNSATVTVTPAVHTHKTDVPRGEAEDELRGLRLVEQVDAHLAHDAVGGAVQAAVLVAAHVQVVRDAVRGERNGHGNVSSEYSAY
jgi:hypothetical protein